MSWTLADWLTLAGIVVAIIVPAVLFLLSRVNAKIDKIDAKIDALSAQMSSMGWRVGRLEGIERARDDDRIAASYAARSNQS